jgi:hypothetical protein
VAQIKLTTSLLARTVKLAASVPEEDREELSKALSGDRATDVLASCPATFTN